MAQKTDKDDPPPRRGRADSVAPDIGRVAMSAFARAGFSDPTLVLRWDEIAGVEVARLARPLRFSEGPSGGVLTLKVEPGAALFLRHETRALCERINASLGRPAIAKLKFSQGPLAARPTFLSVRSRPRAVAPGDPANRYAGPDGLGRALLSLARMRARTD